MPERSCLAIEPLPASYATVGRWLWALEDTRRRTQQALAELTPAVLDWVPPAGGSSIGTILYHIAAIEADWLCSEILELSVFPPEVAALLPHDVRVAQGMLTPVRGLTLEEHLARLAAVRDVLRDVLQGLDIDEFRRPRRLERYDVTPEWVLHHLIQHEAEHRGQIMELRAGAERELQSQPA